MGQTAALTGQSKIVHDFACLLEGHMQKIPEESWHNFQIECLQLVNRFRQPTHPSWQTQQPSPSWQSSKPSPSQWQTSSHWLGFNQWSAANQAFSNVAIPAAPSAVPVPGPLSGPSPSHQPTSLMTSSRRSNELVSSVLEDIQVQEED